MRGQNDQLDKYYQRYTRVDDNVLDYLNSEHAMAIQNSKYVKIEDNQERIY